MATACLIPIIKDGRSVFIIVFVIILLIPTFNLYHEMYQAIKSKDREWIKAVTLKTLLFLALVAGIIFLIIKRLSL